jgi:hypothetical protein
MVSTFFLCFFLILILILSSKLFFCNKTFKKMKRKYSLPLEGEEDAESKKKSKCDRDISEDSSNSSISMSELPITETFLYSSSASSSDSISENEAKCSYSEPKEEKSKKSNKASNDKSPKKSQENKNSDNVKFLTGQIKSRPDGDFISKIHEKWFGNYMLLECHHGYIQWLFPLRTVGVNNEAQALQQHEIKVFMVLRKNLNFLNILFL